MAEKLKIPYPVIVEGRYDKLRLQNVIEAQILTTDGFGMFNKTEKTKLFRALSQKTPIIVLTDSDGAGKLIRSHITSMIAPERLIHLYVPRIAGKERRKVAPSAEGILGVEGMENQLLHDLFLPYADAEAVSHRIEENPLCKADLYRDGLTGGEGSAARRDAFAERLGLPAGMTPNALLAAVRVLCTYDEYCRLVGRTEQ
jgi:ribonuclease M5